MAKVTSWPSYCGYQHYHVPTRCSCASSRILKTRLYTSRWPPSTCVRWHQPRLGAGTLLLLLAWGTGSSGNVHFHDSLHAVADSQHRNQITVTDALVFMPCASLSLWSQGQCCPQPGTRHVMVLHIALGATTIQPDRQGAIPGLFGRGQHIQAQRLIRCITPL